MKAWHFAGNTLRDGSPIPKDGEKLLHDGELVMCKSGLHASKRIIDALKYAPGHIICRVDVGGDIQHQVDKLVATERTILWRIDGEEVLRKFARMCALDVIHLWDAPQIVIDYLKTGDESKRDAARGAAWAAARAAARDAAWAAARGAARDAARAAARGAARTAAWGAARAAAQGATWVAAWDAASDAAWGATWAAARGATWAAARDAAWVAAWDAENKRLTRMILRQHRGK